MAGNSSRVLDVLSPKIRRCSRPDGRYASHFGDPESVHPRGLVDLHSHLLPGVDDGAKTVEESIAILERMAEMGFTDVVLTPHYVPESKYMSPYFANFRQLQNLKREIEKRNLNINLHLGNEIYIDREISMSLKRNLVRPLNNGRFLLIELPLNTEFQDYLSIFQSLQQEGYQILLAHPERYSLLSFDDLLTLAEYGVFFQCNFGSIVGQYGKTVQKTAKKLIKHRLVFCFGTDTHKLSTFDKYQEKALKKLQKYYKPDELDVILHQNPRVVLN